MAIEIVDFPLNSMVVFHSYVTVYHKVSMVKQAPGSSWVLKPCQPFGFPADLPSKSTQSFSLWSIWGKPPRVSTYVPEKIWPDVNIWRFPKVGSSPKSSKSLDIIRPF